MCGAATHAFCEDRARRYLECPDCGLVSADPASHLSPEDERAIYDLHQNDPADARYRAFLARLADPLRAKLAPGMRGLDFGCGPGPVLSIMLREAGLALWGASRPALLVWWLNQGVDGSQLVGDAQDGASLLQQAAQHRGLPIRLPLADLSEQLLISDELLQGDAEAVLQEPAVRYEADMQLLVLARQRGSAWQADWRLLLGDGEERGQLEASDQASLADALLLTLSQRLAPRFVVRPEAASQLVLEVQGADLARFAQLERVLEPFAARLLRVEGDRLRYRLQASAQQLHAQLSLLQLQVVPAEVPAIQPVTAEQSGEAPLAAAAQVPAASAALLQYRWP